MERSAAGMSWTRGRLGHNEAHGTLKLGAEQLALDGGDRNQHAIVLVPSVQALSLQGQHACYLVRTFLDADGFAYRVLVAEQVFHHVLPQQGDAGGGAHVRIRERVVGG